MPSTTVKKSSRDENKAIREYLELCKHWVYNLYTNYGVRFNDLYRALVHYREPWVDTPKLRSAIERWKKNGEPGPWPSQQIPETPGFVIQPPPLAPQHLLSRLRVSEAVPKVALSSMAMPPLLAHHHQEMLHYTDLSSSTPTSMMSPNMLMHSDQASVLPSPASATALILIRRGTLNPDHATQWQQLNRASDSNDVFRSQSQTTVSETTENEFRDDAGQGTDGSICSRCGEQVDLFCACNTY